MSMRTRGQLKHKFALKKMRLPTDNSHHVVVQVAPAPLIKRDDGGASNNNAGGLDPIMLIGICLAGATLLVLAVGIVVRRVRKRTGAARAARTMERGLKAARASVNGHGKPEMQQAWRGSAGGNASDDTHVVDFVYGDKVRSSFESSDYNALSTNLPKAVSRAAVTASVVLPSPAATRPSLKAIDVQRANNPFSSPPNSSVAPFSSAPSSVQNFYGPAVLRSRTVSSAQGREQGQPRSSGLPQASAMRALALAAGVAAAADEEDDKKEKATEVDLPVYFSPFRASTFGGGMKLGEHLGIRVPAEKDHPESVRSQDSKWFSQDSISLSHPPASPVPVQEGRVVPPSPGARPGTAGTFGQPLGSFAGRIPYKTRHKHAASSLSIADVRSVRVSYASGLSSPIVGGFRGHSPTPSLSHGRTQSTGSAMGVSTRKVQTVFPPLLPDELVLRVGEKVTLLQTFDDEWCVVGRDRFGEVEVGAVPAFVFTKAKSGETFARPMRSTSLGVQVEMSSAPGAVWSSREEVISWSNF